MRCREGISGLRTVHTNRPHLTLIRDDPIPFLRHPRTTISRQHAPAIPAKFKRLESDLRRATKPPRSGHPMPPPQRAVTLRIPLRSRSWRARNRPDTPSRRPSGHPPCTPAARRDGPRPRPGELHPPARTCGYGPDRQPPPGPWGKSATRGPTGPPPVVDASGRPPAGTGGPTGRARPTTAARPRAMPDPHRPHRRPPPVRQLRGPDADPITLGATATHAPSSPSTRRSHVSETHSPRPPGMCTLNALHF